MCCECKGMGKIEKQGVDPYTGKTTLVCYTCPCQGEPVDYFLRKINVSQNVKTRVSKRLDRKNPEEKLIYNRLRDIIYRKESVALLCGDLGKGKTTDALRIALNYVRQGQRVSWWKADDFINIHRNAKTSKVTTFVEEWERAFRIAVDSHLFLDDLCAPFSDNYDIDSQCLRLILESCRSVVITSNHPAFLARRQVKPIAEIYSSRVADCLREAAVYEGCYRGKSFRGTS